jgi:hypothetical protein
MRNVFKKALFNHIFNFNQDLGIVNVECDDVGDRDYLITELQELACNMEFADYEIIPNDNDCNLEIVICG